MPEDQIAYMTTPVHQKPRPATMGVTIGGVDYPSLDHVPDTALRQTGHGLSLDIVALHAHERHWKHKRDRARTDTERILAEGVLTGLGMVNVIHDLPLELQEVI